MGTNFTWLEEGQSHRGSTDPEHHIGKRSAAGLYCFDCQWTLCKKGVNGIHFTAREEDWHKACPSCGQTPAKETLSEGTAGLELGFAPVRAKSPESVASCSSFSFAQDVVEVIKRLVDQLGSDEPLVEDDYGRQYTAAEFLHVLEECPIHHTHSVGTEFS